MGKRKPTNKYYFSVEGETEQWYLKWLQDLINNTEESACKVSIDCPVKKNPLKHAKSLTVTRKIEVYHFFDLWIILHMADCNVSYTHRKQYITPINKVFGEKFENMDEYKHEDNFKRCLSKMNISNVIDAIRRAKKIMQKNQENGYSLLQYKGYRYYKENPSLSAWEAIEKILSECKLL